MIRQTDPAEREALRALHDGDPDRYLDRKAEHITLHADQDDAADAAVDQRAALRDQHGPAGVVMIARDNTTWAAQRGRPPTLTVRGQLGSDSVRIGPDSVRIGSREWAVGDRVIARRNDRGLNIDNGTLGTIASVSRSDGDGDGDGGRSITITITTDSGETRALPGQYVARHLEHAYAITGYSSQGATVQAAVVIGRPEDIHPRMGVHRPLPGSRAHRPSHHRRQRAPLPPTAPNTRPPRRPESRPTRCARSHAR